MKRIKLVFTLVMIFLFSISCIRYYKTSSIRKQFKKNKAKIDSHTNKIKKDYELKKEAYAFLVKKSKTKDAEVYKKLKIILLEMEKNFDEYEKSLNNVDEITKEFIKLSKGKKKIKSDSPLFDRIGDLRERYQYQLNAIMKKSKKVIFNSNDFNKIAKKNKIGRVESKKIYERLSDISKKLNLQIEKNDKKLKRIKNKDKNTILKLKEVLSNLKKESNLLAKKQSDFDKKYLAMKYIWNGPGIEDYQVFLKEKFDKISKLIAKFNKLVKELW